MVEKSNTTLNQGATSSPLSNEDRNSSSLNYQFLAKALNFSLPIKLDQQNYLNWKAAMLAAIRALELEDFISSPVLPPTQLKDPNDLSSPINPKYKNWKRSDQLLLCWLFTTVSEQTLGQINMSSSALEAWKTLENQYAQISMVRIIQLKNQLTGLKKGSMFVCEYIQQIKSIGHSLLVAGNRILESELVLCALNGVGHEFDPAVVFLSHSRENTTLQEVQYSLMMHEQRIEHLNSAAQINLTTATASANLAAYGIEQSQNIGGFKEIEA